MKFVTISAPGKLMLLGEHAVVYNHPCLVTAVDQRMFATVEIISKSQLQINAPDIRINNYKKSFKNIGKGDVPKGVRFIEIAIKNFFKKFPLLLGEGQGEVNGLKISTHSQFSSQFGFGSSSSVTVCVIKALSELLKLNLSNKQIFDIAYKTVLDVQGKGSGFDIAAAVFGGTLYFLTGGKIIKQIYSPFKQIKNIILSDSEESHSKKKLFIKRDPSASPQDGKSGLPIVVGYSGVKADTVTLMKQVKEKFENNQQRLDTIYNEIENLVEEARDALIEKNFDLFGQLMNVNQNLLTQLGVSTPKLDEMISAAKDTGAYGAKLSGAGGGDCMIALCCAEKRKKVEQNIENVGGKIVKINANAQGVRIEP